MNMLKLWIISVITNAVLGLAWVVAGVYAMVQVYGWVVFGWMSAILVATYAIQWITWTRRGQSEEAEALEAAVERAHREE